MKRLPADKSLISAFISAALLLLLFSASSNAQTGDTALTESELRTRLDNLEKQITDEKRLIEQTKQAQTAGDRREEEGTPRVGRAGP